jgi:battenin
MLPLSRVAASSWARYRARISSIFEGADVRVCVAFWLFGLINNVLYVIILTAALDLVGPSVPKGVVLLADVLPSFFTKLLAPYFIKSIPYSSRIWGLVILSTGGMLLVALTPTSTTGGAIGLKMAGVMVASLSSGAGELSFLSLTHYYGHFSLASWGSGTGGAGLIGAGAYAVATTTLGLEVRTSLLTFSFLPLILLVSFFGVLPLGPLRSTNGKDVQYSQLGGSVDAADADDDENPWPGDDGGDAEAQSQTLLSASMLSASGRSFTSTSALSRHRSSAWENLKSNLKRSQALFFPYMLPLLLVYVAEYTINQGVAPTLLYPLSQTPFTEYREFYPTYNAIYQVGVFVSRSSTPFFRVHHLYLPSLLQVANLVLLTLHALFNFIPSVHYLFVIIFWEGLLGGLVYVSTFAEITDNVPLADREFSLGATSVSDSGGICIAGFIGMAFEVWLCQWQVDHGRNYCTLR